MTELEFTNYDFKCSGRSHQMGHLDIDEAVLSLGMSTVPPIGFTVNLPTGYLIRDKLGKARTWQAMGPRDQIPWFINEYHPRIIAPFIQRGIIVFELTKQRCIHFHMICWDETVVAEIDMAELTHSINNCVLTKSINSGRNAKPQVLNFVHFLKDVDDWIGYLKKEQYKFKDRPFYLPYFWNNWSPERPLSEVSNLFEPPSPAEPPARCLDYAGIVLPTVAFPEPRSGARRARRRPRGPPSPS